MYIASIDCGTTNSRVYILNEKGLIIGKGTRPVGVRDTSRTKSKQMLKDGLVEAMNEALESAKLQLKDISFAISAGMITSEIGLLEIPHIQTPAGLEDLAKHLVFSKDINTFPVDISIYFIPGIRNQFDLATTTVEDVGFLDFMRGEETQVAGYLDSFGKEKSVTIVILSSHTKFVHVDEKGKITQSMTSLSGQVFDAIKKETFIGKSIEPIEGIEQPKDYIDAKIINNAMRWQKDVGFIRSLLMIRFLDVLLHSQWYERRLFFETLIATEDIQLFKQFYKSEKEQSQIVFIGPKSRCDIYSYIFEHSLGWSSKYLESMTDTHQIDLLNIKGSIAIAKKAGLMQ